MHHLVTIARPEDPVALDIMVDALWIAGAVGIEEVDSTIRAAFTDGTAAARAATDHAGHVALTPDSTGLDGWREHASSYRAGVFHLRPPWHRAVSDGVELIIDPGHAFGSGSHPSTRLILGTLDRVIEPGDHVLDLGTGSGVLAVAAARLGATVTAVDLDPAAATAVTDNAATNRVADRVHVHIGDIADLEPTTADVVLLNVTIDIHELVAGVVRAIDPDRLVIAGVLAGDQAQRAAHLHDRTPREQIIDGEWAAIIFDHGRPRLAS